jgi:DNA-binding transcriptional regulator YiaG
MTFAKILSAVYHTYNYDSVKLANKLHVSLSEVKQWESGEKYPNSHQLDDFSAMFAIPLATLKVSCK